MPCQQGVSSERGRLQPKTEPKAELRVAAAAHGSGPFDPKGIAPETPREVLLQRDRWALEEPALGDEADW